MTARQPTDLKVGANEVSISLKCASAAAGNSPPKLHNRAEVGLQLVLNREHGKETKLRKLITAFIAAASVIAGNPAGAAEYLKVGSDMVAITGPIQFGDETKFRAAVSQIDKANLKQAGVILRVDTPGGNVFAAQQIAAGILAARSKGIPTTVVVPAGSVCASSCVIIFAAASHRVVEVGGAKDGVRTPSAALYVHTAAEDGKETAATMAASVELARIMKEIGTPDTVVAKLLLTGSREGTRLDARDLRAWENTTIMPFNGSNS